MYRLDKSSLPANRSSAIATLAMVMWSPVAFAQTPGNAERDAGTAFVEPLRNCQQIADDRQRLACFDREVGTIVAASDAGDVRVVDGEDVRRTRRSLFGFNLPDLGLFGSEGDDPKDDELFETTITNARYASSKRVSFTTAEGAVWEMKNVPRRLRRIEPGAMVVFKPAALGYFFARIDGQMGVKARRVQ